jgi:hypothetical protein
MKTRILAAMFETLAFVVIVASLLRQKFPSKTSKPTIIKS